MEPSIETLVRNFFEKKGLPWRPALTFEDVTIITKWSSIKSRKDVKDFRVQLAKNFTLNLPLVSANMADVTDSRLAIALARLGGLGFIPQFASLEKRVEEILRVKRADNALIENPIAIGHWETLGQAKEKMKKYGISSVLAIDDHGYLYGILTSRDYRFQTDDSLPVEKVMTLKPLITAHVTISMEKAREILEKHKIEKLPIVDHDGRLVALVTAKDMLKEKEFPNAVRDKNGRLAVGAALRLNSDCLTEAKELLAAGADVLLLDTARGGSDLVLDAVQYVQKLKAAYPDMVLAAGNVDNPEHVKILAEAGADCIKIGIGPGARCKTRRVAGVGTPQIYAIAAAAAVAKSMGVYIIGDGGIEESGELAKALVAGADAVMSGSLFVGTEEAPGIKFWKDGQWWKQYRGSASQEFQQERIDSGSLDAVRNPEGESAPAPYVGLLEPIVGMLIDGLCSSMSYVGALNLREFEKQGEFLWVTQSGNEEGKPKT